MAKQTTRQVSIFINGKEVENSIKGIAAEQSRLNNKIKDAIIGTEEYESAVKGLTQTNTLLREHRQAVSGIEKGWSLTKVGVDKFIGIAAGAFAVENLLGYGKQLFGVGVQMDALNRKAQTVFGVTLPAVTAEAKKNAEAMGLTTSQYINAAAAIQDILIPMGFQREEASKISTNLVNLSGALSEWTGGQVSATEVSDILSSALTGERERLKQLGIVLQQSDIDARLAEKGLSKLTGAMKQQAEASATLELVLEKSTDAQAAFANGSDSAVRRQAELTAKIQEITEKLATLLLPVFEKLAAFAGSVVGAISDVVDGIDALVNPAKAATKAFDEQAEKVADLEGNISPLLDRYDELTGKSNLSKKEQDELKKIITQVSGVIPGAIQGFDDYGRALGLNTTAAREFIEVERARLKFINQEAITATGKQIDDTQKRLDTVLKQLREGQIIDTEGTGLNTRLVRRKTSDSEIQQLQAEAQKLQDTLKGANAEVSRLKGEDLGTSPPVVPDTPTGTGGKGDPEKAKKEAERLQKELTDLVESVTKHRRDLLSKEQEDELAIAINGIEDRYNKEIAKALELEKKGVTEATAQRIALEQLKQEEIGNAVVAFTDNAVAEAEKQAKEIAEAKRKVEKEEFDKDNQERAAREEERLQAEAEIKAFKDEALLTEQQQELERLEEHYKKLIELAKKYGFDVVGITKAYEEEKADIVGKSTDQQKKFEKDLADAKVELEITKANAVAQGAGVIAGLFEQGNAIAKALFLVEKAATVVSIILSLQKEKAAIRAAARLGTVFDPTGISAEILAAPQIAAANIRAGVSIATVAATAIKEFIPPKTKQKAAGGYLTVTGETDGRRYNASVIPPPYTGLLPDHPVLFQSRATGAPVLASERGSEYFVSAEALRNPYVANLTRMIDNITLSGGRGVPQFADGGANPANATAPAAAAGVDPGLIEKNMAVMEALLNAINRGIVAVIPDRTLTAIPERLGKINDGSGGYFG